MTSVWEELRGNDCDPLLEKSTVTSDGSVELIEFPIQSSPDGKKLPSVEEEIGGNNSGHSSDKSTTSSDKSTLTSVSVKSSDSPGSSPPSKRLRPADDQPRIDLGGVGSLSMEDHLNYAASLDDDYVAPLDDDYVAPLDDDYVAPLDDDYAYMPKVDVRAQFRGYAEFALAHYNKEKGLDYEYIGVRAVFPFRFPSGYRGTHLNFFARLRGSGSEEMCFFYAELNHVKKKVSNCCILPEERDSEPLIQHPSHVRCEECESGGVVCLEDTDDDSWTSEDEDKPPVFM